MVAEPCRPGRTSTFARRRQSAAPSHTACLLQPSIRLAARAGRRIGFWACRSVSRSALRTVSSPTTTACEPVDRERRPARPACLSLQRPEPAYSLRSRHSLPVRSEPSAVAPASRAGPIARAGARSATRVGRLRPHSRWRRRAPAARSRAARACRRPRSRAPPRRSRPRAIPVGPPAAATVLPARASRCSAAAAARRSAAVRRSAPAPRASRRARRPSARSMRRRR